MLTLTYYKIGTQWFLDNPEFIDAGGHPSELECIGGLAELLDQAACGQISVQLIVDLQPFVGADEACLVDTSGEDTGAYYRVKLLNGQELDLDIWFSDMIYRYFPVLPSKIYGKFL